MDKEEAVFTAFFVVVFLVGAMGVSTGYYTGYSDGQVPLGQIICDEQYGEGLSEFFGYKEGIVSCKSIEPLEQSDGGYTRLIKGGT